MESYPLPARRLVAGLVEAAAENPDNAVAFQGAPGAYSHQAVRELFPDAVSLPCFSFEEAIDAVRGGSAGRAVIPIENSLHGRVADVHFLLPESGLHVVGEHYVRVRHCLLGLPGSRLEGLREVLSHPQALGQTRRWLRDRGLRPVAYADTAAAAAEIVAQGDPAAGAVASALAAELYDCAVLAEGIEDAAHNTTRFVVLAPEPVAPRPAAEGGRCKTMFCFEVRNVPAALFKALGGFATNGVQMTKLESYLRDGGFTAAEFLAEIEGAPGDEGVARALDELRFHSKWVRLLGTYPIAN